MDDYAVLADHLGHDQAYKMLTWNYKQNFKPVPTATGFPAEDADPSWCMNNLGTVATFFDKGTMSREHCIQLGLSKDWANYDDLHDDEKEGEKEQKEGEKNPSEPSQKAGTFSDDDDDSNEHDTTTA